jgi:V/A-type H+-transporting ATPase subunit K
MIILGIILGLIALLLIGQRLSVRHRVRSLVGSLIAVNAVVLILAIAFTGLEWLGTPVPAAAAPPAQQGGGLSGTVALAAGLSTGLAALASGIAVASVGSAAIGAISENPENLGRTLIFVGLAEGIAIYGLIMSFLILTR